MRKIGVCAILAAIGLMAAAGDAYAPTAVEVNCTMNSGALAALFTGATPGGTENTTYFITGTGTCTGNFTITHDNITISPESATQTINGSVTIQGANNIVLTGFTGTPDTVLIIQNAAGDGVIAQGAHVTLTNTTIQNNGGLGVRATGGASVSVLLSTVSGNAGGGVWAEEHSLIIVVRGTISSAGGPMVGPAVAAILSSSVRMQSVSTVIGPDNAPTIFADQNSAVSIDWGDRSSISTSTREAATPGPAVVALHSSSVTLFAAVAPTSANVMGPSNNHTIFAAQGSSVSLRNTNVTADTPFIAANQLAVLIATGSSSAVLAGGNTINNSAMGGAAVILSDGSSLIENNGTPLGFVAAVDAFKGDGKIRTQSVIELGASPGGGGVDWTGDIRVAQASSFVADGDNVTINGTLTLNQAANGYFNHQNGTTNNITSVVCKSTTDHVSNPTLVTPNITIGAPPGCALF